MTMLSADEATELARSVRAVCDRMAPEQRIREVAYEGDGFDRDLWRVLCGQVGVTAIALPEELGGAGYGAGALGVVAHELGRALAPVPFLASTVLATNLLLDATEPPAETLAGLTDGSRIAAPILTADGGAWRRSAIAVTANCDRDEWTLEGAARHVLFGAAADDFVVIAAVDGEPAVFLIGAAAPGVFVHAEPTLDRTRPMATVTFSGAPARRISGDGPCDDIIARTIDRAIAVLSAEQVGTQERVLEIAVAYAGTRQQFGRPIGSFQAIKHRCADMLVGLEWARSASQAALQAADDAPAGSGGELSWRASMAKAVCSEALRDATHANLQIHGGIGFTWEDAAHLYLKRARTDEVLFGGTGAHWDRLTTEAKLL